jgi:tRNA A-37 threonylcarbamoyl transferase component Bud32
VPPHPSPDELTRSRALTPTPGGDSTAASTGTDPDRTRPRTDTLADTAPAVSRPDAAVPGYEVLSELGRGGMGVVYRAVHLKLNRPVALKMVLGDARADSQEVIRFLAEAGAVAAVKHPRVVGVYDFGEHDGRPYLALEFCDGGTLAARLKAVGRFDPRTAAELVANIADGVAAAHAQGIVHRDLKPANVLFAGPTEPKVADFGLAKRAGSDHTKTNAVMGTPAYMSPEQAKGDTKFVGPQADVWALGVMLFECLTGRRPFAADDPWALLQQVMNADPPGVRTVVSDLPKDLEQVVRKCLHKVPHERYATAAELAADLRRWLGGQPVSARPPAVPERLTKWVRRNPLPTALIAALVLLVATVGWASYLTISQLRRANEAESKRLDAERGRREEQAGRQADLVQSAMRQAMQRGQATAALAVYDRAEADGLPLTTAMRLDRARALYFLGEVEAARTGVEAVNRDDLPADRRGEAELLAGVLALGPDDARGLELIRTARKLGLSQADDLYAQGLLADSTAAALAKFQAAYAADPTHIDSRVMAALALTLFARYADATTLIEQTRPLAPDHPALPLLHLAVAGMGGDATKVDALLADLRGRIRDPRVKDALPAFAAVVNTYPEFQKTFAGIIAGDQSAWLKFAAQFRADSPLVKKMMAVHDSGLVSGSLIAGFPPCFRNDLLFFVTEMMHDNAGGLILANAIKQWLPEYDPTKAVIAFKDAAGAEKARKRLAGFPEGSLKAAYAMQLAGIPLDHLNAGRGFQPPAAWVEAGAAFVDAADTPGHLHPRWFSVHYAAMMYVYAAKADPKSPAADGLKRTANDLIARRLAMDPPPSDDDFRDLAIWAYTAAVGDDYTFARQVVEQWGKTIPKPGKDYHLRRALVEEKNEAYGPALRAIDRVPLKDLSADDRAALQRLRDDCRRKLNLPELLPPPRAAE